MAIARRRVDLEGRFDADGQAAPGIDSRRFTTRFTELRHALLPDIQASPERASSPVISRAVIDGNARLPTHDHASAQAPRRRDPGGMPAHCHQRRRCGDRAGVAAARNTRPVLPPKGPRDMGGGRVVMPRQADAPITVPGRHRRCLRPGYTLR